jgi:two-component system LytT family response regulator
MTIRTLIVDDEPLARERLQSLLRAEPRIEVVGECTNGLEAIEQIRALNPGLVFLDVQMPELDGFGVLRELEPAERPAVVFVTAFDQFAVKAFEVHAIDYLLKPFDRDRLTAAVDRVATALGQKQPDALHQKLTALIEELRPAQAQPPDRLLVKSEGRMLFVRLADIDWMEAADNYVSLHVGKETHLLRETMTSLEARLSKPFLRISRSTMVNTERIRELQPLFHGDYAVILQDGTKLTLTRGYRDKLQQLGVS